MIKKMFLFILILGLFIFTTGCGISNDIKTIEDVNTNSENTIVKDRGDETTLDLNYYYADYDKEEKALANKLIGKDIMDIEMTDSMGNKIKLSDYKGKKIILQFADSTCSPCMESIPIIKKLEQSYEDIVFLKYYMVDSKESLNYAYSKQGESPSIHTFPGRESVNKDVDIDAITSYYGVDYFPSYYFINEEGKISLYEVGGINEEDLKEVIDKFAFKTNFLKK